MDDQLSGRTDDNLFADDQFGGRTDDDLFADEFEPVHVNAAESLPEAGAATPALPTDAQHAAAAPTTQTVQADAPGDVAESSHAKPAHQRQPRKQSVMGAAPSVNNAAATPSETSSTPAPSVKVRPGSNTALADRLASGANPRTKLSEVELAEKMEKMRILSAEKARKFEQAEQDSRSHAIAYEKGMEEAQRRHAEDAKARKKDEEDRRQMDQERAANRERKLKAMGARGGGWDEGKPAEGAEDRRGFRGANGGIRGARYMQNRNAESPVVEFAPNEFRGRGRGRGRGGPRGGRGGRGAFADRNAVSGGPSNDSNDGLSHQRHQQQQTKPEPTPPTAADFPALPSSNSERAATTEAAEPISWSSLANPTKLRWDEM